MRIDSTLVKESGVLGTLLGHDNYPGFEMEMFAYYLRAKDFHVEHQSDVFVNSKDTPACYLFDDRAVVEIVKLLKPEWRDYGIVLLDYNEIGRWLTQLIDHSHLDRSEYEVICFNGETLIVFEDPNHALITKLSIP